MALSTDQISNLHRKALAALSEGQLRDAHHLCLTILNEDRTHADAWFICGVIAGQNGQAAKAVEILNNAIHLDNTRPQYLAELGKYQLALHDQQRALDSGYRALELEPVDVPTLNTLGTLFSHCADHESAIVCYKKAALILSRRPVNKKGVALDFEAETYFNLASSLRFAGQFDEAEAACEEAIKTKPDFFKAHWALASLKKQTEESNHLARLKPLKGNVNSPLEQLHLGHALAKELEDLGLFEEAMANLEWAKQLQKSEVAYNVEADLELFSYLGQYTKDDVQGKSQAPVSDTRAPIFILGMPRSGTTLVEQILGSHSQVNASGELQDFPRQLQKIVGSQTAEPISLEIMQAASASNLDSLGNAYLESTRPLSGDTPFFTDKLPLNFFNVGLIHRAMPNAKIVCLRRDPMDTCLSNYRQLFASNFRYYHYSYDLMDCGRYYLGFSQLMAHWLELMPQAIHQVQYESLVADPGEETRKLLDYCQLDWEDNCLEFNSRKSYVTTASAVQVREGIYSSSVERWKQYGPAMEPLYNFLRGAGLYD
jgi:tetratricopeptide (TPR) repeat protein